MNKTTLCLAFISSILLFSNAPVHADEKKIIFNTESIKYETGTGSERCRAQCERKSGPDAKSLLSEGWKIVSSSAKEIIGEHYSYTPCNTCLPHGCICIGKEYVLRKDEPAQVIETRSNVIDSTGNNNKTVLQPLNDETVKNELDLLKKEIDMLKQENGLLKKEIETLRYQLGSKQK
ncbi:MAG: hypothetical protein VB050_09680 [Geobacteraceae bacterium]|nr:hypothetical protein [Geobacteraceae bacterium]